MNLNEIDVDIRRFMLEMREDWKQFPPFDSMSAPQQRAAAEKVRARWHQGGPVMAQTQELIFDPGGGDLRVRIYRPVVCDASLPALVYLHGGGFTLFSIDTHDRLMREYAAKGGFAVIGVDYPLAPEAKYPQALDRIEALLLWLKDNAQQWRIDPRRIALGGDSAGGNLSFAACLRLRDQGLPGLVKAVLSNYGGFSSRISDEAEARLGGPGAILNRDESRQYWANYLRSEADENDPQACPILADLTQFPPVLLAVPALDLVAEHSFAMHERLKAAGVPVECKVYPGAVHSFLEAMSISALADQAISDGARFIARHLAPPPAASPFERFQADDIRSLIEEYPLAWVASAEGEQESLLPLVGAYDGQGQLTELVGHFAAANPLGAALRKHRHATILFTGPQGYVSPSHAGRRDWAPTWNYAQVQVRADFSVEPEFTGDAVDILIEQMERNRAEPWRATELGERYHAMLPHIVGFRARVTGLKARFKLGQDERLDTLRSILSALPDGDLSRWMRRFNAARLSNPAL